MEDYVRGNDLGEDSGRWKREWEVEGEVGCACDCPYHCTCLSHPRTARSSCTVTS